LRHPLVMRLVTTLGITRLCLVNQYMKIMEPYLPQPMWNARRALATTTKNCATVAAEANAFVLSLKQLAEVDRSIFADKPCIAISAGLSTLAAAEISEVQMAYLQEFHAIWNELQIELVGRFLNSRQMIATKSDHMIPWHQPNIIVEAVHEIISENNTKTAAH
jgi:hypothetical protein